MWFKVQTHPLCQYHVWHSLTKERWADNIFFLQILLDLLSNKHTNTRSACREYLPINMFNVGEFQSQFVSKHGSKDDFSKKVFIRFVFLLIAVSGVFRVPLLRQESQRTFVFSRKRELIWGWKFVYAASFFSSHFWRFTQKSWGEMFNISILMHFGDKSVLK